MGTKKADPAKVSFNKEVLCKYSPDEFREWFEGKFSGDWKFWYKKLGGTIAKNPASGSTEKRKD